MIDIQFIPDDWERIVTCFGVFHDEEDIIRVGCSDLDFLNQCIVEGNLREVYRKYLTAEALIIGEAENAIAHEVIHIILNQWFGVGLNALWDNIDTGGGISNSSI